MSSSVRKIIERQKKRSANSGNQKNLWVKEGDVVRFHFLFGPGDEPEGRYFTDFVAHEIPAQGQGQYPQRVYCPVLSEHDPNYACPYCHDLETYPRKERLGMWLWVHEWLRPQKLNDSDNVQVVTYLNRQYYVYKVDAPLYWEATGWYPAKACPLNYIEYYLSQMNDDLRQVQFEMVVSGSGLDRNYHIVAQANSGPVPQEALKAAAELVKPVHDFMMESIKQAEEVQRPAQANAAPAPPPQMAPAPGTFPAPPGTPPLSSTPAPPTAPAPPQQYQFQPNLDKPLGGDDAES